LGANEKGIEALPPYLHYVGEGVKRMDLKHSRLFFITVWRLSRMKLILSLLVCISERGPYIGNSSAPASLALREGAIEN
jgi:hypothetical protein